MFTRKRPENAIDNLLPRAAPLGPKLGPVLIQLPPHWRVNPERLGNLLQILPRDVRYAFEFRELSWMNPQVDSLVKKFNATFCISELAGYHSPLNITADFAYVRFTVPRSASTREATAKNDCAPGLARSKLGRRNSKLFMFILITIKPAMQPQTRSR